MHGVAAGEHTPAANVPYHGFLDIMAGGERGCINRTHPQPVKKKKKKKKHESPKHKYHAMAWGRRFKSAGAKKQAGRGRAKQG